jgi:putative Mg2+ transporter-C (MgtC) family protein
MKWLVADWRTLLLTPWAQVVIALAAVFCGAIVGSEREKREKAAGLRTLALVCLGSTTFTMASFAFATTTGDTGRVAAQIVTGIGFLGAGVILHGRSGVSGLTTAATVWAMAAIGIVVGTGYIPAGIGLSLLIRSVLTALAWWERKVIGDVRVMTVEIVLESNASKTQFQMALLLEEFHLAGPWRPVGVEPDGASRLRLGFALPRRQRLEFLSELVRLPDVREIREV